MQLSQPTVSVPWGTLTLPDPLVLSLQGTPIKCTGTAPPCTVTITPFDIPGFAATATFTPISNVSLAPAANGGTINTSGGTNIAGGSNATFASATVPGMTGLNNATVSGSISISAGTITSASYVATLSGGTINFTNATVDSSANLNLTAPNNDVTALAGTIAFAPLTTQTITNAVVTSGTLHFTPSPLDGTAGKTDGTLTAGTVATFDMTLNFPPDLENATVTGTFTIQSGNIAGNASAKTKITSLTGGSIPFSGTVSNTGQLTVTGVTASNLTGSITWVTGTQTDGDSMDASDQITVTGTVNYTATGLQLTNQTMSLTSTVNITAATGVDIKGDSLSANVSTTVIHSMVFGQGEYYVPASNTVTFDAANLGADPAFESFGHTATLLPPSDMLIVGGSDCASAACTSFASDSRAVTYLMQQNSANFATPPSGSLSTARALHSATLLNDGTILVAGGTNGLNILSSAEIFNPATEAFTPTSGSMSNPRDLHTATLMDNGRVLIAGGTSTNSVSTGSISAVDIYYPDTKLFIPTTPMAAARSNHTATLMPDGKVMVVGGFGAGDVITGTAEVFDPEHMTWTTVNPLPGAATAALHTATLLKDGRLMIAGGVSASGVLNTVFAYNPGTGLWSTLAPMPSKLRSHTATLLMDGRVLVAGGDDGNGETTSSYIYDPVADTWTPGSSPTTNPLTFARFGHTATLLPNGSVMISGGSNKFGAIPPLAEIYHVDLSSWTPGAPFSKNRSFHTMTLAPNGKIYAIGGADGVIGGNGTSYLSSVEEGSFFTTPDVDGKGVSATVPSLRISSFTISSVVPLQNSEVLTLAGSKLLGATEASGGGAASANSSFAVPHLILQKTDASDFILDLTTYVFSAASPATNAAMSATLPAGQSSMPSGWYNARVGVNGVYSNGTYIQVGPAKPASAPTNLIGTAQGVSSITWTWNAVAGVDGYDIYQASTNIFIATVPANSFIQTGLPANAVEQITVAGFTLTGDGPAALSPTTAVSPITTVTQVLCGTNSSGDTTTSIQWDWTQVSVAQSYNVYNSTTGALITNVSVPSFYDVNLATNSMREIAVAAVTGGIEGPLSPPTTCYTLAATPLPPLISQNLPLMTSTSPTTVSLNWIANGNPSGTIYQSSFTSSNQFQEIMQSTALAAIASGLTPANYYQAAVFAVNGAGTLSAPLIAGTTFTLPAPPASLNITGTTPVSLSLGWSTNANSTMTYYQVVYGTAADFTGTVTTAVPFSSQFTSSSFTLTGLITGQQYFVSVQAENRFGQTSVTLSTGAVTFNGGAPFGSLAGILTALGTSEFSGTIGFPVPRTIDLRSPGGAFPVDTDVTISTYSLLDHGALCSNGVPGTGGAGVVYSIENSPQLQPTHPVFLTGSYLPSELGGAPVSQVALARFDPGSGTCVPLETTFQPAKQTFVAQLNHFSLYQLVTVPLATAADTARLYPNPYRAATDSYVTIDQVPPSSRVRVFTLRGEKILDAMANGAGLVTWHADNSAGRPVASGLYLVVVESGGTKKILKLVVVR